MKISARADYALRALVELSLHWPSKKPLQIADISKKQNIPERYLVQILIQLKRLDLVKSVRGKEGGYNLAKAPSQISLGHVMRQIGGELIQMSPNIENNSVFTPIWKQAETAIADILDDISFEEICSRAKKTRDATAYQI